MAPGETTENFLCVMSGIHLYIRNELETVFFHSKIHSDIQRIPVYSSENEYRWRSLIHKEEIAVF